MNGNERRVIHLALAEETDIKPESAGEGNSRHVRGFLYTKQRLTLLSVLFPLTRFGNFFFNLEVLNTIVAVSTPPGRGYRLIIRLSGTDALESYKTTSDTQDNRRRTQARHAQSLRDPSTDEILDRRRSYFNRHNRLQAEH